MDKEALYKLVLLGKLHKHQADYLKDSSAEIINPINKILVEILSDGKIKIKYNYFEEFTETVLTTKTVYSFFEGLLTREEAIKIDLKNNDPILIADWKNELKEPLKKNQLEKDYNQYLKHLKIESDRFEIEYFNGLIILRDRDKVMMTNILEIKNAVQHAI